MALKQKGLRDDARQEFQLALQGTPEKPINQRFIERVRTVLAQLE